MLWLWGVSFASLLSIWVGLADCWLEGMQVWREALCWDCRWTTSQACSCLPATCMSAMTATFSRLWLTMDLESLRMRCMPIRSDLAPWPLFTLHELAGNSSCSQPDFEPSSVQVCKCFPIIFFNTVWVLALTCISFAVASLCLHPLCCRVLSLSLM